MTKERRYSRTLNGRFVQARSRAARRGLTWRITAAQYATLVSRPCSYCGGPLPLAGGGLDRINNRRGYVFENVRPCCTTCNTVRNNLIRPNAMEVIGAFLAFLRKHDPDALYINLKKGGRRASN